MTQYQLLITILILSLVTISTRFLPFLWFKDHKLSPWMQFSTKKIPLASIGMLMIYGFKDVTTLSVTAIFMQLISLILIAIVYKISKSTLWSLAIGVSVYLLVMNI